MSEPLLLPKLELFEDYGGNWNDYIEAIYSIFRTDFVENKPAFRGKRLGLKRYPISQDKEATFWHFTSEGASEEERTPDFRRCERIRWPAPTINNSEDQCIKVWAEPKGSNLRIHLWFEAEGYLVVLDDRKDYILPWTAFYIEREHQKRKYNKRWLRYGAYS